MPCEGLSAAAVPSRLGMVEARRGRGTYIDDTEMMREQLDQAAALLGSDVGPAAVGEATTRISRDGVSVCTRGGTVAQALANALSSASSVTNSARTT